MRRSARVGLVVLVALAGCSGEEESPPRQPEAPPGLPRVLDAPNNATGCGLGAAIALVSLDQADASLPEGYEPADAQGLLGAPAATGQGAIVLSTYTCTSWELTGHRLSAGEVNVLVTDPGLDADAPPAARHFYMLALYTREDHLLNFLRNLSWKAEDATVDVDVGVLPGGVAAAVGTVRDVFELGVEGAASNTLSGRSRFWHATPNATTYVDYELEAASVVATGGCTMAAGSVAAEALGASECPTSTVGVVVPNADWVSAYHRRAG